MMKRLLVPTFIFAVVLLGYGVYRDSQMKKRQEMDQLIQDAHRSLRAVEANPNNRVVEQSETSDPHFAVSLHVKSSKF